MFSGDELMVASQFSKNEYRQRELLKAKSQEQLRAPLKKHPSVSHAVTLKEQYTWELEMKTQIQHIMQDEFSEKKILQSYIRKRSRDDAKIDYQRSSTTQAWRRRLKQEDYNILGRGGGETFGRVGGRRSWEKHGSYAPPPSSSARPPRKARLHRPFLLSLWLLLDCVIPSPTWPPSFYPLAPRNTSSSNFLRASPCVCIWCAMANCPSGGDTEKRTLA
jgi:hypothetical protein